MNTTTTRTDGPPSSGLRLTVRRTTLPAMSSQKAPKLPRGFANKLRAQRQRRGLTLDSAAELLGVGRSTYARWEAGHAAPRNRHVIDAVLGFLGGK